MYISWTMIMVIILKVIYSHKYVSWTIIPTSFTIIIKYALWMFIPVISVYHGQYQKPHRIWVGYSSKQELAWRDWMHNGLCWPGSLKDIVSSQSMCSNCMHVTFYPLFSQNGPNQIWMLQPILMTSLWTIPVINIGTNQWNHVNCSISKPTQVRHLT